MSSPSLTGGSLYGILVFVLYLRFWGLGGIFSLRNSRIFVIASEAKQSLEILNSPLGILEFLGVRGCLFWEFQNSIAKQGVLCHPRAWPEDLCDEIPWSSRVMTQGLGNSRFILRNSRIPRDCFGRFAPSQWRIFRNSRIPKPCVIPWLDQGISSQRSSGQARGWHSGEF